MLILRSITVITIIFVMTNYANAQYSCFSAIPVVANTLITVDTTFEAASVTICGYPYISQNYWYVYTAEYTGPIEITSCTPGTTSNTLLAVYTGPCGSMSCEVWDDGSPCAWSPSAASLTFDVIAGNNYYIRWGNSFPPYQWMQFQWIIGTCESQVQGTCYYDLNMDGSYNTSEPTYNGLILRDGQPIMSPNGQFHLCSLYGQYTLTLGNPPAYHLVSPPAYNYITSETDPGVTGMDFSLQPIPGMYDVGVNLWGLAPWIGNNTSMWIRYKNVGTEPTDATLELHIDPLLQFFSASVTPDIISGSIVSWELGNLPPRQEGIIEVRIHTPPSVPWNTLVTNWATLTINESDLNIHDNHAEWKPMVVAAYDPNDKQVTRTEVNAEEVSSGVELGYTIRFQNIGNAPAVNVVIRDTIDDGVELTSFNMSGATHEYLVALNGREIVWTFPNIMLPDSATDLDGSIGVFHYRLNMRDDLLLGDQVQNTADIYFDYADPITTNTVTTTVGDPVGLAEFGPPQVLVHPVPSTGIFSIRWLGVHLPSSQMIITDGLGRQVHMATLGKLLTNQNIHVDLTDKPDGLYLININSESTASRARVILHR